MPPGLRSSNQSSSDNQVKQLATFLKNAAAVFDFFPGLEQTIKPLPP
jgi:hypothetical protein